MDHEIWLDQLIEHVCLRLPEAELYWIDRSTLCLVLAHRNVTVHQVDDSVLVLPSFVTPGAIGRDIGQRVQHQELRGYEMVDTFVATAVEDIVAHLQ